MRLIAFGMAAIVIAMGAIELQRALEEETADRPAVVSDDPLRATLQRCRALTPEALQADTECQAAWAENRRRFFRADPDREGVE
ncbi:MAG: putative entry exclusion protein TrbK-alt [Pseudomonadota bacterium]